MPAPLLVATAQMMCPHPPGHLMPATTDIRVKAMGQAVLTITDKFAVLGCGLTPTSTPPCTMCQWATPAARVMVQGQPALLQTSVGTCLAGAVPNGPAAVLVNQTRVMAT